MGAEDTVTVQYLADISDLQAKFDTLGDAANEAMDKVSAASAQAGEELEKGVADGADKAKEKLQELQEESEGLGEKFDALRGQISAAFDAAGITLAVEAIREFGHVLEEAMSHAVEVSNM